MTRNIAVDAGKYDTKAVLQDPDGSQKKALFRTKASLALDGFIARPDETHYVCFDGAEYKVGSEADDSSVDYNTSKMTELHRIATYTAISCLIEDGDEINLCIGCPISIYSNKEARIRYRDYIAKSGQEVTIAVDGTEKTFSFRKVMVCAEGSGVLYLNIEEFKDSVIGIIDIGGLNINCSIYEKLRVVPKLSFTDELGSNRLMQDIRNRLESEFATAGLEDYLLNSLKEKGYLPGKYRERSAEIFTKMKEQQVERILASCEKAGWKLDFIRLVFVGGSSIFLQNEIRSVAIRKRMLDVDLSYVTETGNFLNAFGFLFYLLTFA